MSTIEIKFVFSFRCCFRSTETFRIVRDGEFRMATLTFTQFLSSAKLKRKGLLFKVPQIEVLKLNNMQPHKEQMHAAYLPTKKEKR